MLAEMRVLALCMLVVACSKKTEPPAPTPSPATTASVKPESWPGVLADRTGAFDVTTAGATTNAALTGKACAFWTTILDGAPRVFFDEWPRNTVVLTIEGHSVAVPTTSIRMEAVPVSVERDYKASDADAPPKAKQILTATKWMDKDSDPPATVRATERCLTASTTYRGEVKKEVHESTSNIQHAVSPGIGGGGAMPTLKTTSYYLVLSPK